MEFKIDQDLEAALAAAPDLSQQTLATYVRLWQLEIWLRRMIYVELRAKYGDQWETHLSKSNYERARRNDQDLTHMPTSEELAISYVLFTDLCETIQQEWSLFQSYLPPQDIWMGKLKEVKQIRNRVAHYRIGHRDDFARVVQLLRDIDKGIWRFCTSMNASTAYVSPSNDSRDPVIYEFAYLIPYAPAANVKYDGPKAFFNLHSKIELSIEVTRRPWQTSPIGVPVSGEIGFMYDVSIVALELRSFDYASVLERTRSVHPHIAYICLEATRNVLRVIFPTVLGRDRAVEVISVLVAAAGGSTRPGPDSSPMKEWNEWLKRERLKVQELADSWPEYVIGPDNPITFLGPDMEATVFGA